MHHDTTAASRQKCPSEPVDWKWFILPSNYVEERNKNNPTKSDLKVMVPHISETARNMYNKWLSDNWLYPDRILTNNKIMYLKSYFGNGH